MSIEIKDLIKPLVPRSALKLWRSSKAARIDAQFATRSPADVFSTVYREKLWGIGDSDFSSGTGSHHEHTVAPYIECMRSFLAALSNPNVVDLGCGDFSVGGQLRAAAGRFIACDVVPDLIERNRLKFAPLDVDFRRLDIVSDPLPAGDVAILRQVLQHLSNYQIRTVLEKLQDYRWVVLTEHLPFSPTFKPNVDKPMGPGTRLRNSSGVVITSSPFYFHAVSEHILCSVRDDFGLIQTVAYEL